MKFFSIAIFSLLILFESISAITEAETNLVLVQVMVRHGVRSILREYPNDPHEDYWNKYGRGQLHPVGMKQLQDYGAFIMNRYSSFINSTYDHNRVYARSTNYDRTLQSAGAFLAGAFKPASWQSWTSTDGQSAWLPIPIHTDAFATDPIIGIETTCPRMDQLKDQVKNGPIWKANETQYQAFLDQMKALSGLQSLDVYSIYDLADKYKVQDALGLSQEKYLVDNIDKILMIDAYSYNYDLATQEMARLTSGGLLNYALTNMKSKLNMSSDDANRQLYVYAIHDTYMAGLQKIFYMSSTNFTIPDFASSFVYELRNDTRGNYYVQMLFKNNKAYDPITLNPIAIEGCDVLCPLDKFESLLKGSIATDYKQLCIAQPTNLRETISYYFNQFTSWLQGKI